MRPNLAKWMNEADTLYHIKRFELPNIPIQLGYLERRGDDYYISLVGELFDKMRNPYTDPDDWSRLGNALTQAGIAGERIDSVDSSRIISSETALFAAAAFYLGGFSASAYFTLKAADPNKFDEIYWGCIELLARPTRSKIKSEVVGSLIDAVHDGNIENIHNLTLTVAERVVEALEYGPEKWVGYRLLSKLLERFETTNLRAVLPVEDGEFWNPLIWSFLYRTPPVWDFFPSQIGAFRGGLLTNPSTISLQMPTGAGKTALTETLLFYHTKKNPEDLAVLLVPLRSLASELKSSLVKRLNRMGVPARSVYGGTVPMGEEFNDLDGTRVIVATPEALSGLLSANQDIFSRIKLVICDEGHLLDAENRGVGLELLLSRLHARSSGAPRFVFVSAIVPNIEEINVWLGGTPETVIRSEFRPAIAEFAMLNVAGRGSAQTVALQMHPHETGVNQFSIDEFLTKRDFQYTNLTTGRLNTYSFKSIKTQAIASARKALSMGAVAVFAANKAGNQGAVGLAKELLSQLANDLLLPNPLLFVSDPVLLDAAVEYFSLEYGNQWIGTLTLASGAVLHHGDIPQESREVIEELVRRGIIHLAICTNTLAEGVNLPIRTLVLYSVQRRDSTGRADNLLSRDIKNLVGRAGRAGATTKGLVICTNPSQWSLIEPVANQRAGEPVIGALFDLIRRLERALSQRNLTLTNEILEGELALHTLVDGVDAALIDLVAEELGEDEFIRVATNVSDHTFAANKATAESRELIRNVFRLRAQRIGHIRAMGRIDWIRESGARVRLLDSVEESLLPTRDDWDRIQSSNDPDLIKTIVTWVWEQSEMEQSIEMAFRGKNPTLDEFSEIVQKWIAGESLINIATAVNIDIDTMLAIHSKVLTYALQVAAEQAVCLLKRLLDEKEMEISRAVIEFPEHLRFGVPTSVSRILAAGGIRHRRASVALGLTKELNDEEMDNQAEIFLAAQELLKNHERWLPLLGSLILDHTIEDVDMAISRFSNR